MNAPEHLILGALAGTGAVVVLNKHLQLPTEPLDVAIGALVGGLAALAPDVLEPATNPHHRAIAHSMLALGAAAFAVRKLAATQDLTVAQKKLLLALCVGYGSHLCADALTPMGLPLLT